MTGEVSVGRCQVFLLLAVAAVPASCDVSHDGDDQLRVLMQRIVRERDDHARLALLIDLEDKVAERYKERRKIPRCLRLQDCFTRCLEDGGPLSKMAAARLLGRFGDKQAIEILITQFTRQDGPVLDVVIESLEGLIGDPLSLRPAEGCRAYTNAVGSEERAKTIQEQLQTWFHSNRDYLVWDFVKNQFRIDQEAKRKGKAVPQW